jgi:hypothetical protein
MGSTGLVAIGNPSVVGRDGGEKGGSAQRDGALRRGRSSALK